MLKKRRTAMEPDVSAPIPAQGEWIEMADVRRRSRPVCLVPHEMRAFVADADEALLYKSYLRSLWRYGVRLTSMHGAAGMAVDHDVFMDGQRALMGRLLHHSQAQMACNPEDRWQVLGYVVFDDLPSGLVLHYIYVKKPYRAAGLATSMLLKLLGRRNLLVVTHWTAPWLGLRRALKRSGVHRLGYNPYLAR